MQTYIALMLNASMQDFSSLRLLPVYALQNECRLAGLRSQPLPPSCLSRFNGRLIN